MTHTLLGGRTGSMLSAHRQHNVSTTGNIQAVGPLQSKVSKCYRREACGSLECSSCSRCMHGQGSSRPAGGDPPLWKTGETKQAEASCGDCTNTNTSCGGEAAPYNRNSCWAAARPAHGYVMYKRVSTGPAAPTKTAQQQPRTQTGQEKHTQQQPGQAPGAVQCWWATTRCGFVVRTNVMIAA
jgi:hypothetical protein